MERQEGLRIARMWGKERLEEALRLGKEYLEHKDFKDAAPRGLSPETSLSLGPGGAASDWSSLMTEVHKSLKEAEDHLRLIHMNSNHKSRAVVPLLWAKQFLNRLQEWCDEE